MCEEVQTGCIVFIYDALLRVREVYPCPIYQSRSLLTAWKENIFIRAPLLLISAELKVNMYQSS